MRLSLDYLAESPMKCSDGKLFNSINDWDQPNTSTALCAATPISPRQGHHDITQGTIPNRWSLASRYRGPVAHGIQILVRHPTQGTIPKGSGSVYLESMNMITGGTILSLKLLVEATATSWSLHSALGRRIKFPRKTVCISTHSLNQSLPASAPNSGLEIITIVMSIWVSPGASTAIEHKI